MKRRERGLVMVEFALIGALYFTVLFAIIELGRMAFVWNALTEATRRGARLAAVCDPASSGAVQSIAVFGTGGGSASPIVHNLTTANINVAYSGIPVPPAPLTEFVTVTITGYTHQLNIPFFNITIPAPDFRTTVPVESRGFLYPGTGCPTP